MYILKEAKPGDSIGDVLGDALNTISGTTNVVIVIFNEIFILVHHYNDINELGRGYSQALKERARFVEAKATLEIR